MPGEDATSVLLDQQITDTINDLLESDAATLDDALALVWISKVGLWTLATDQANGCPDEMRGPEMTHRALARLDLLLSALGAKRTFAIEPDNALQVN